jgi:hypothetical protein
MDKTGEGGKRLDELMIAIVFGVSKSPASGWYNSIELAAVAMPGIGKNAMRCIDYPFGFAKNGRFLPGGHSMMDGCRT